LMDETLATGVRRLPEPALTTRDAVTVTVPTLTPPALVVGADIVAVPRPMARPRPAPSVTEQVLDAAFAALMAEQPKALPTWATGEETWRRITRITSAALAPNGLVPVLRASSVVLDAVLADLDAAGCRAARATVPFEDADCLWGGGEGSGPGDQRH